MQNQIKNLNIKRIELIELEVKNEDTTTVLKQIKALQDALTPDDLKEPIFNPNSDDDYFKKSRKELEDLEIELRFYCKEDVKKINSLEFWGFYDIYYRDKLQQQTAKS